MPTVPTFGARMATKGPAGGEKGGAAGLAKYKLVFLGDQSVGKTSIITRFMVRNQPPKGQACRRSIEGEVDRHRRVHHTLLLC